MTKTWRIPNIVFWVLGLVVIGLTAVVSIYVYPSLPDRVVTHFDFRGTPDGFGQKSVWVLLPLGIQGLLTLVLWFAYRHPAMMNLPMRVPISRVAEPWRGQITRVAKHMSSVLTVILNLLLAYVMLGVITVSFGFRDRLNVMMLYGILVLLVAVIGLYSFWIWKLARLASVNRPAPEAQSPVPAETKTPPRS